MSSSDEVPGTSSDFTLDSDDIDGSDGGFLNPGSGDLIERVDVIGRIRSEFGETAIRLLRNPINFILIVLVGALLNVWQWLLRQIQTVIDQLGFLWVIGVQAPIEITITPLTMMIEELGDVLATGIADGAAFAGPFAPMVVVAAWGGVIIVLAAIFNALLGLLATYIPIESIPVVRRWV